MQAVRPRLLEASLIPVRQTRLCLTTQPLLLCDSPRRPLQTMRWAATTLGKQPLQELQPIPRTQELGAAPQVATFL
jgi:hypothetical protein